MKRNNYTRVFFNEEKIRSLLFKKRITQLALANKMSLSRQYVNTVINRGSCNFNTLSKMASALNVEPEEILLED